MASFLARATLGPTLPRMLCILLLWLVGFGPRTAAAQTSLSDLSPCGLTCLLEAIPHSSCSVTDSACQCSSRILQDETTACLMANCTMQDSLDVSRFQAAECGLASGSRSTEVIIVMSVLYGVAVLFVLLRVTSKLITRTFCIEDHLIIYALLLAAAPFVCIMYMAGLGFGGHIWDLQDGALTRILRLLYVAEIMYIIVLAITKASIVCMYLRIFWAYRPFQIMCYTVLAFIILSSAVITALTIASCEPIAYFWNRDIPHGSCLDVTALAYANSGFAVAQDLIITLLPIYMLWTLNMSRKKKLFITIMFAVGGLGLIATIVRLRTLSAFGNLSDPTWTYTPLIYWTTVELAAGVIASCLPAVRILLERSFKVFSLSTNRSEPSSGIKLQQRNRKPSAPEDPSTDYSASQTRLTHSRDEIFTTSLKRGDEPTDNKGKFDLD